MGSILHQTTVIRDGMHNGFTDLQYWQGAYWVGYRKGAGHVSMDAHAVVSVSHDRSRFTEIATARVKGDVRDPKLLPIDDDRMAIYFPSWLEGAGTEERDGQTFYKPIQQYISFTTNGHDWEPMQPILDPLKWLWRIRKHDGKYYGLIQNLNGPHIDGKRPHQLELAVSDDLLNWEVIAQVGDGLNESDIYWHENGEAWIISRYIAQEEGKVGSIFATAKAPYTDWQTTEMKPMVHAPIMLEHNGEVFVAGRSRPSFEGITDAPFNAGSLSVWRFKRGELESVLRMPATGDCSYPGLIKDPDGRICISYYSQHAYHLGIVPRRMPTPDHPQAGGEDDVYFAELDLP